jgi:RNase P subunit RPR2
MNRLSPRICPFCTTHLYQNVSKVFRIGMYDIRVFDIKCLGCNWYRRSFFIKDKNFNRENTRQLSFYNSPLVAVLPARGGDYPGS